MGEASSVKICLLAIFMFVIDMLFFLSFEIY